MLTANTFKRSMVCIIVCILGTGATLADVRLPRLVGENMVLQRDSKLLLWGWGNPGEIVTLEFHGQRITTKSDTHGRWSASLGPFGAGGPYEMLVKGKNSIRLKNLLIGDVWLASGQSNMEASVGPADWGWKGVNNADVEIAAAQFPQIRLFKVHRRIALQPTVDAEADGWSPVTPTSVTSFSAVAYFFGRELHQRYHIPIGLIDSSWGGTVAEAWVSEDSLKNQFPEFRQSIDSLKNIDEPAAIAEDQKYLKAKPEWYNQHGAEDRGRVDGLNLWAAQNLPTANWETIDEPQTKAEEGLKGFDGVVWFRKEIDLAPGDAGKDLKLHLAYAYKDDTTFFNGQKIGATQGGGDKPKPTDYLVPGKLVRSGRNIIVVRIKGSNGSVGLYSDDLHKPEVVIGDKVISLAGQWLYQPGPDITGLPVPSKYSKLKEDPNTATLLFNGMIAPLTTYRIKGSIWYQGESNAIEKRSAQYRKLFPALILDWRKQWGYEFPFLFVQLAGWPPPPGEEPEESSFAELREAQEMTLSLPATGMASAVDQPEDHPTDKQTVAHRLALTAAAAVYGEHIVDSGPVYKSMQIEGSQIRITFSNVESGLLVKDKYGAIRGFEIAAADGKFHWAQARREGQEIVVFNDSVSQPVAVRYDWMNTPEGNLFNAEGLPATPFRTDAPQALNASR